MGLVERLAVARGDAPATLALRNARLVNVLTGEIYLTDVLIESSHIAAIGPGYKAEREIDLDGRYLCPGLIDAHVHIESSLCTPPEFARAVLAHGVTTVVTDPHEIANVLGLEGIRFMLERAKNGALNMYIMASSCVPATTMETSGARLEAEDLQPLLSHNWVLGLAEMMNYPGVVFGDEGVLDKIVLYKERDFVLDGHCPGLRGMRLNAYVTTGIQSDHECTTVEEALEKLRLGLTIFIREATNAHNLRALLPMVTPQNFHHICLCTDDRIPADLLDEGSIDHMIRVAVAEGIDPVIALRMATVNPARYFALHNYGVIAPSKWADMVVFSDLNNFQAEMVFRGGILVAENGVTIAPKVRQRPMDLRSSMNVRVQQLDFSIPANGSRIRVIGSLPGQLITEARTEDARIEDGNAVADIDRDILKMAVVERHRATGNVGKGFIKGFGLKRGAIAGTVAHDHHNLVVIGADDESMTTAARTVIEMRGGLAAVEGGNVLTRLPLPVAGLMSEEPIETVRREYDALIAAARDMGSTLHDPFMAMSFMALEVIPSLKLTDMGLVDVEKFEIVDLFV